MITKRDDVGLAVVFVYPLFVLTVISLALMWYYVGFYLYSIHLALAASPLARMMSDAWSTKDFVFSVISTGICGLILYPVGTSLRDQGWWIGTIARKVAIVCLLSSFLVGMVLIIGLLMMCASGTQRSGRRYR